MNDYLHQKKRLLDEKVLQLYKRTVKKNKFVTVKSKSDLLHNIQVVSYKESMQACCLYYDDSQLLKFIFKHMPLPKETSLL